MTSAFVVEWDPKQWHNIVFANSYGEPIDCGAKFRTAGCGFSVQKRTIYSEYPSEPWVHNDVGNRYSYPIDNTHKAESLALLLQYVQKFQLFYWVQYLFDNVYKGYNRAEALKNMNDMHVKMLKWFSSLEEYNWCAPYAQCEDSPIKVYELDTTKDFKPCFFIRGYKMRDNRVSPYLYVMLEKESDGQEDRNMFDFNIKFIGSDKPLSKYILQVPVYDIEQENNKWICQKYCNRICQLISSKAFGAGLKTYTSKEKIWCCFVYNSSCKHYVSSDEKCKDPCCPWNAWTTRDVYHDGSEMYKSFCKVFGTNVGDLVINDKFTHDKWHLMQNVCNNENFIDAFNEFCTGYRLDEYRIGKNAGVQVLRNCINHIKTWGNNPNSDVIPYLHGGTVFHIPTKEPEDRTIPCMITRSMEKQQ